MARRRSHGEHTYRVDSKTGLAMARVGVALWSTVENPSQRQEFHSTNIYGAYPVQRGTGSSSAAMLRCC